MTELETGEQHLTRSAELVAELRSPDFITNPKPPTLAEAAGFLHGYFAAKAHNPGEASTRDTNFENALDDVVTVLGGLYARDEHTGLTTVEGSIGQHRADVNLEGALRAAHHAQQRAEQSGHHHTTTHSTTTATTLAELERFKHQEVIDDDARRSLRRRAADAIRTATRASEQDPAAYPHLAQVGMHVTDAISALSNIVALHERDTGSGPNYRDYLARHMSSALELSES